MSKPAAPILPPPPPAAPVAGSTFGKPMFFGPDCEAWKELKADVPLGTDPAEEQKIIAAVKAAKEELKNFLLSSLQMQHVVVLAGSGTSLGPVTKGPSMWTLSGNKGSERKQSRNRVVPGLSRNRVVPGLQLCN